MLDGLRGYLQIASGLTEVPRQRAATAVRTLLAQGETQLASVLPEDLVGQVGELTDDLLATSRANRDLLLGVVRGEVERQVARLGLVSAGELAAATERADALESRLQELEVQLAGREAGAAPPRPAAKRPSAKKTAARAGTGPGRASDARQRLGVVPDLAAGADAADTDAAPDPAEPAEGVPDVSAAALAGPADLVDAELVDAELVDAELLDAELAGDALPSSSGPAGPGSEGEDPLADPQPPRPTPRRARKAAGRPRTATDPLQAGDDES